MLAVFNAMAATVIHIGVPYILEVLPGLLAELPRAIRVDTVFPTVGLGLKIKGWWLRVSCPVTLSRGFTDYRVLNRIISM